MKVKKLKIKVKQLMAFKAVAKKVFTLLVKAVRVAGDITHSNLSIIITTM